MVPYERGRIHRTGRRVRLYDVDRAGRVRFDAIARYLQDVATDDVRDAGVEDAVAWVVRRTAIAVTRRPRYGEPLELATWCSGTGTALAERRTSVTGEWGAAAETVSLWVCLDRETMRPVGLRSFDLYRESAGDRKVKGRFTIPVPDSPLPGRPWPLRASDFDILGHVNNAVSWTAVEEEAAHLAGGGRIGRGQVEYRRAIEPGEVVSVAGRREGNRIGVWLLGADGAPATSAQLELSGPG
jgi:acyl-ACP thioesterase